MSFFTEKPISESNFDGTDEESAINSHDELYEATLLLGMVFIMSVCIVGSVSNIYALGAIIYQTFVSPHKRFIRKWTSHVVLLLNLALADFLYCSISLPFMFTVYYRLYKGVEKNTEEDDPHISNGTCSSAAFLRYINAMAEWTTLGLLALERCVSINKYKSFKRNSKWWTFRRSIIYCALVWTISCIIQIPTLLGNYSEFGYNEMTLKCDFLKETTDMPIPPRIFFFGLESFIPFLLIFFCYLVIIFQVFAGSSPNRFWHVMTQKQIILRRSRAIKKIVLLLSVYLVCVFPVCSYNIYLAIDDEMLSSKTFQIIGVYVYCVYWVQYGINIFIYFVCNEAYRGACWQFFDFIRGKNMRGPRKRNSLPTFTLHNSCKKAAVCQNFSSTRKTSMEYFASQDEAQNDNTNQARERWNSVSTVNSKAELVIDKKKWQRKLSFCPPFRGNGKKLRRSLSL